MCSFYVRAVCLILILFSITDASAKETLLENELRRDFRNFFETGQLGSSLSLVVEELDLASLLLDDSSKSLPEPHLSVFCSTCAAGFNEILRLNDSDLIFGEAATLCVELGIGSQEFCDDIISVNEGPLLYIITNSADESGNDICGVIFFSRGCHSRNPDRQWSVELPDVTKPPVDTTPYPEPGQPTLTILQLSDTHYDPEYTPGSSILCDEIYLCCRGTGIPQAENDTAGFWGSYGNCDIPKWTVEAIYKNINETNDHIDFILWTGDIVPHDVWLSSKEDRVATIREMSDLILEYFPGVPVYPAVGNHDTTPVNLFPQPYITDPEFDISWLYDELVSIWGMWLPNETASSIAYSAYYSVQVMPGLKIISINTNYCYSQNWWLILDSSDIAKELDLLAKELQKSEDIGEFVYLIGHIPPGTHECLPSWSHEFNRIVSRYENTISGIFYGHSHNDALQLFFDTEDLDRVVETIYIGPSQTTYSDLNPGYKIFTVEGNYNSSRYRVLDYETWVMNITLSTLTNETDFYMLYSAKEEYELEDLSPQSWQDLAILMSEPNSTLFDAFYRNKVKASDPKLEEGCDEECKYDTICDIFSSDTSNPYNCNDTYPWSL